MSNNQSLEEQILSTLAAGEGRLKAKQIARRIRLRFNNDVDKKDVNQCLYGPLAEQVNSDANYTWALCAQPLRQKEQNARPTQRIVPPRSVADQHEPVAPLQAILPTIETKTPRQRSAQRKITCRRCRTQATVSERAGGKFTCPGCGVTGRIPARKGRGKQNAARRELDAEQSWLPWVLGKLPEQNQKTIEAANALKNSLSVMSEQITNCRQRADAKLDSTADQMNRKHSEQLLRNTAITVLKNYTTSVRIDALRQHGLRTMADLVNRDESNLNEIHGIGPTSAKKIVKGVQQVQADLNEETIVIPGPYEIEKNHRPILSAAYERIRARRAPTSLVDDVLSLQRRVKYAIQSTESECGLFNRLLSRERTVKKRTRAFELLDGLIDSEETAAIQDHASEFLNQIKSPDDFGALKHDYHQRTADYASVFDRAFGITANSGYTAPATDHSESRNKSHSGWEKSKSGNQPVIKQQLRQTDNAPPVRRRSRGPQGGLSSEIASRVAQTQLHADDLDVDLRGYQEFGAKYLLLQKHTVLGDEMGLGKTIQALAVMAHLSFKYQATHFLVVAPASIMGNWNREVVERTEFTIHMLHGPNRDQAERIWIKKGGVGITSYTTLDRLKQIRAQDVDFAVVDEAHYIKNPKAIRSKAVRSLTSRWKRFVLMTGTPLENKVGEFLNLITLCDEELGKRLDGYREHASDHPNEIADFESQVSQVYLRRNQEDVLKELPPCLEVDEWVTHSEEEAKGYRAAVSNRVHMMTLRRLANGEKGSSAKFERVKELLQGYHEDGQKVVIFSFFKTTLDIVSGFADSVFRIDGDIAANQRLSIIDEFSQSTDCAPLLSQIEAGGVGLNIQAASVVILIEPQWKPTTEWQAIKRVHRMGQSRRVIVHRMLTRNTVDQSLKDTLSRKSQVFDDYARESSVKDGSPAAVDTGTAGLKRQVMQMELDRLETTAT